MKEQWKPIEGYDFKYEISNFGRIKSFWLEPTGRIIRNNLNSQGRYRVRLAYLGKRRSHRISRLVAQHFLPDWNPELQVDHINGDKGDNSSTNLRMMTSSENNRAFRSKARGMTSKYRGVSWHKMSRKWLSQIKTKEKVTYIGTFESEYEAARAWNAVAQKMGFFPEALNNV